MYYLYLCICTSAKCMSVELKVYLFIWSHNFQFSMSLSLSPNSLYRQTTDCTEGKIYMCLTKYSFHIIVGTRRSIWDYFPSSIKFCRWGCSVRLGSSCAYHVSTLHRMPLSFCRGSDRMVVGFTTTYAISSYHHWCCEFESRSGRGVQHYFIKFYQWLVTGRWFSPGPPVSSTNKTDRHDITEILLKVALNTIEQTNNTHFYLLEYRNIICLCPRHLISIGI